jgi:hypothetical protein
MNFFALLSLQAAAQVPPPGSGWQYQGVRSGVTTHSKPSPSGHLIFHGSTYAKGVHISELIFEALDDRHAGEWVDKLLEIRSAKWSGRSTSAPWGTRVCEDVCFQVFDGPWPVSDREMLMHRVVSLTAGNRTARIMFDPAGEMREFPVGNGRVRAEASSTFQFVANDRELGTQISLMGYVNPKGSLPTSLINLLNRDWAANTISGLLRQARRQNHRRGPAGRITEGACKGVDLSGWGSKDDGYQDETWGDWLYSLSDTASEYIGWPAVQGAAPK